MDGHHRIKIKIGQHEFEAEGPSDVVSEQFKIFNELVASFPSTPAAQPQNDTHKLDEPATIQPGRPDLPSIDAALGKIMKLDNRIVSLTVRAETVEDAVLLLLYGQKMMRESDSVTGGEVLDGLKATGGTSVSRVDRVLEKMGRDGDVIVIGERRGKRYRLTNAGLTRGRQIATSLLATVA